MEDRITLVNNNDYGATELQTTYQRSFREGLLIAVLLHVIAIAIYIVVMHINNANAEEKKIINKGPVIIVDLDAPPPVNEENILKIKPEDFVKPEKNLAALDPTPVAKELSDKVITKTQDELDKIQANVSDHGDSVTYIAGNMNNVIIDNDKVTDKVNHDNNNIKVKDDINYENYQVGVPPECTNLQQVRSTIAYPKLAIEANIEGRVTIRVLVGKDGNVLQVGSVSGNEIFYDEVKEKSKNLIFTPGLQNNTAVKVWVTVPFNFKLKN